jgi:polyisoprenyl-phosphate glycosyltransferase
VKTEKTVSTPAEPRTYHLLSPRPYPARLSLVFPVYNEETVIPFLRREIEAFVEQVKSETEVVLVNDGSSDKSLDGLLAWASEEPRIKVVHLSRNFGHQIAATAGLDRASGDAIVLMDADLQDPLPVVHQMIERYCEGYDVVYGQREVRAGETRLKLLTAWGFYRLMRLLVYSDLPVDTGDFRLISSRCLKGLRSMRETHRFLRGMVAWVGYPQFALKYKRAPRVSGNTKYPYSKLLTLAWTAATSFSTLPLKLCWLFGCLVGVFGLEEGLRSVLAVIFGWPTFRGWTSLMVLTSIIGSVVLMSLGILGQYVGKIYEQSKGRPLYLVSRTFNLDDDEN